MTVPTPKNVLRILTLTLPVVMSLAVSCAYFNTFYYAQRNYKDAERERRNALGMMTNDARQNYNKAIEWSGKVLEDHRDSRYADDSMFILAMSYYRTEQYVLARDAFESLERVFNDSEFVPRAKLYRARSLVGLDEYEEARIVLSELTGSNDRDIREQAAISLVEIRYLNKEWEELVDDTQIVIESEPEDDILKRALLLHGEALYETEDYKGAIETLDRLVDLNPIPATMVRANTLIAQSLAQNGNYDEALQTLQSMENRGEYVPYEPDIRLYIGIIQEQTGDTETAITTYRNMAGDFPDSTAASEAWYRVGRLLLDDLENVDQAKEAFNTVKKPKGNVEADWSIDAQLKSAQIDSMRARISLIEEIEDDPERRAQVRFSLADLYANSFGHPDSAATQYEKIIEEDPESEFAVRSHFALAILELEQAGELNGETERQAMLDIIERFPKHDFSRSLRDYLGMVNDSPEHVALREAEKAKYDGVPPDEYIPLYREVVDLYPDTRSAFQARLILAYTYEHEMNDMETALEIYQTLADEEPTYFNREFIQKAREKLAYYAREPELLAEINKYIADYDAGIRFGDRLAADEPVVDSGPEELTGYRKIRARNARIRSRYYDN